MQGNETYISITVPNSRNQISRNPPELAGVNYRGGQGVDRYVIGLTYAHIGG